MFTQKPEKIKLNFVRTCQILKSLGDLHKVVAHKAVNDKLSGLSKISTIFQCNHIHEKIVYTGTNLQKPESGTKNIRVRCFH